MCFTIFSNYWTFVLFIIFIFDGKKWVNCFCVSKPFKSTDFDRRWESRLISHAAGQNSELRVLLLAHCTWLADATMENVHYACYECIFCFTHWKDMRGHLTCSFVLLPTKRFHLGSRFLGVARLGGHACVQVSRNFGQERKHFIACCL